ncbi:putative disease resistance RPP13-like protein 3 isoform X1 [Juglans microcarpa x Juglans regia]|uniref:putative disease resistance RPP13-like protein 3 isoform X1 n=1 Tax=Juglans microcarpa x Juglans regia TaxID=2249226 RepID=UPI001B7E5916|nr:putative disease resistance RPP13-like protein 3 isoform X1 [Juglans microcarpa x Juglans regia]
MDVWAVVSLVIRKLTDLLIQESNIFKEAIDEVEQVRVSLRQMKNFFTDAEDKKERGDAVMKCMEEFLALVYNAEDAIETFVLQRMHSRRINFPRKYICIHKKLRHGADLHNEVQNINEKIEEIKIRIQKIKEEKPGSSYQDEGPTQNQQNSQSHSMDEKSYNFGFEEAKSKLVTRLIDTSFRGLPFISIVGVGGSGKTALARTIYNSSEIIGHFACRAWVSASKNLRDVLLSILEQMGILIVDEKATDEELVAKIRENLQNKKFLVVLDDVQSLEVLKGLRVAFSKETVGSKVLLTTMDEKLDIEEAKSKLVTSLTNTSFRGLPFISIVGVGGSGKTALARTIYNSSEIIGHFDCRARVSASENLRDALLSILEQMGLIVDEKATDEELVAKIRENLQNKKFLVVLDDVQSLKVSKGLRVAFSKETVTSKVLLTTRNVNIARFANPSRPPYQLMPLNDEDTWKLFLKHVHLPDDVQFYDSEVVSKLRRKIITTCKGLPLTIILLGGLLSTKTASYKEWLKVLDHPSWNVDIHKDFSYSCQPSRKFFQGNENVEVSKILALKYDSLPFHLRPCLLYLGLFPKGYKIPVRRLLRLWLAEGFVEHSRDETPEDMVEEYLDELLNQKMIEIIRRKDGSPKICVIREELHDIILSKAKYVSLFHIHRIMSEEEKNDSPKSDKETNDSPMPSVRRVAGHGDIIDYPCNESSYIRHLRSYLSFNIQKKDIPAKEIRNFLSNVIGHRGFGLLRVLDLERVYKPQLPENLEKLFQLRYLGLRWTFLDTLPHSVGELPYLETLDVKHTYISSLPNSIWKMKHLRHLCLNEIRLDMSVQKHRCSLTRLQTFWGLFVDNKSPVKNVLNRLTSLRKLGLTYHLDSIEELNEWIARLSSLQSLRLRSKDENGRPSELALKPLSSLENLTHLYLLGNLPKLYDGNEFPPRLRVLTLSVSKLTKDPMPILAQLPSLSVLRLLADSYTGKKMLCPREGFGKLQILHLWMLKELEEWTVEEEAMQNLREIEIRCCHELNEIPDRLLNLSTIEKIVLTNMPEEFAGNVQADKHKKLIITKTLQF